MKVQGSYFQCCACSSWRFLPVQVIYYVTMQLNIYLFSLSNGEKTAFSCERRGKKNKKSFPKVLWLFFSSKGKKRKGLDYKDHYVGSEFLLRSLHAHSIRCVCQNGIKQSTTGLHNVIYRSWLELEQVASQVFTSFCKHSNGFSYFHLSPQS